MGAGGLLLSILSAFRMTLDRGSIPLLAGLVPTPDAPKDHRRLGGPAVAALVLIAATACSLPGLGGDPRLERCGIRGTVARTVELAHARDFFTVFPEAGLAPELDQEAPAVAFVYLGPVEVPTIGRGRRVPLQNAVCVVVQGEPSGNIYPRTSTSAASSPRLLGSRAASDRPSDHLRFVDGADLQD